MRRALIVIVMLALVVVALAAGTLAAHWPYWRRAWQWHSAAHGWPEQLGGPTRTLQPAAAPAPLTIVSDPSLAQGTGTSVLMVADATGQTRAYFVAGMDERSSIDGRELSVALQVVLFGALMQEGRARLLDEPLGNLLAQWKNDARGVITPRQLFWQLSGLAGSPFTPLNPFSPLSQLASGPDFQRAVFRTPLRYPPGSHFAASPANAQLLGLVAGQLTGEGYAAALQRLVWSRLAAQPATGLLDHRRWRNVRVLLLLGQCRRLVATGPVAGQQWPQPGPADSPPVSPGPGQDLVTGEPWSGTGV